MGEQHVPHVLKRRFNDLTFEEMLEHFIESRKSGTYGAKVASESPDSERNYTENISRVFDFVRGLERNSWREVTEEDIAQYIKHVSELSLARATKSQRLRSLKAFMFWIKRCPMTREYPVYLEAMPVIPMNVARAKIPGVSEVQRFVHYGFKVSNTMELRDFLAAHIFLDSGIRAGELSNIRLEDIKWDRQWIEVGGKMKSRIGTRMVPFSDVTARLIKKWLRERVRIVELLSPELRQKQNYLMVTRFGSKTTNAVWSHEFKKHSKRSHTNVTPHSLRHFFATQYLVRGGTVSDLKAILGHTSYAMMNVYVKEAELLGRITAQHAQVSPVNLVGDLREDGTPKKKRQMVHL